MSPSKQREKIIVVPETHWDRAWYLPFELFRRKLVQLMDRLQDLLEKDPDYTCFVADGQTVVMEDYLQIRPERRERLEALVRARRLRIGPWYVLPDEFIVSGESLVRNLSLGMKQARAMGGVMQVGYVPDPFGHVTQLPQILNGFGLDSFLFTRGIPQTPEYPIEFKWSAPDGSTVLALNQHPHYGNATMLGYPTIGADFDGQKFNMKDALDQMDEAIEAMRPRVGTGVFLLSNGIDHVEAQPNLTRIIEAARRRFPKAEIRIGGFDDYVKEVRRRLGGRRLKTVDHELTYPHGWMLKSVYSARVHLKQANALCERLLCHCTEPLVALASRVKPGRLDEHGLIGYAWSELLKNHPHDDICGCSVNRTHEDMENRFARVEELARVLANDALRDIGNAMDHSGREGTAFVVFNPSCRPRRGAQRLRLWMEPHQTDLIAGQMRLVDSAGKSLPFEIIGSESLFWWECRKDFRYQGVDVWVDLGELPPAGFATLYAQPLAAVAKSPVPRVHATARALENEHLLVRVAANGTFSLTDKRDGTTYQGLGLLEDTEDCGDTYNWSDLEVPQTVTSVREKARIEVAAKHALAATLRIHHRLRVPEAMSKDRKSRSRRLVDLPVTTELTLRAGATRLEIVTTVDNRAQDHRLRVLFPTGFTAETVQAGGHFDSVERPIDPLKQPFFIEKFKNEMSTTEHFAGWVRTGDKRRGLGLLARGLCEYEAVPARGGTTLALTLLRSVGWLSRGDFHRRPANAGPSIEAPSAQMQGTYRFEYALVAHKGDWEKADLAGQAQEFALDLMVDRGDRHGTMPVGGKLDRLIGIPREGVLPDRFSLVDLGSDSLVLTALKRAENGRDWVVRFFNQGPQTVQTTVGLAFPAKGVWLADLAEKKGKLLGKGDRIRLRVGSKKIITLIVKS